MNTLTKKRENLQGGRKVNPKAVDAVVLYSNYAFLEKCYVTDQNSPKTTDVELFSSINNFMNSSNTKIERGKRKICKADDYEKSNMKI